MQVAALRKAVAAFTLEWEGETCRFEYNPNALSNAAYRRILSRARQPEGEEDTDWLVDVLVLMLTGWDLMETAKKKYPLTRENIDALPPRFLVHVYNRMFEDMVPPEPATSSGSTS